MRKLLILSILTVCLSIQSKAQSFTRVFNMDSAEAWGSAWGDYNNDGYPDLYVSSPVHNHLYKNNKNGSFTQVFNDPSVTTTINSSFRGCSFADYNNDGFVDIYTTVWDGGGANSFLFKNDGKGHFVKTTALPTQESIATMAVGWADLDNDGKADLVMSNYSGDAHIFFNEGKDSFSELTKGVIVNTKMGATGIAFSDFNDDGFTDVFFSNEGKQYLFINNGNRTFSLASNDVTLFSDLGRGCTWGDYDNDGDMDLFIASRNSYNSALFRNDGAGKFTDITKTAFGASVKGDYEGSNFVDIDNDGWLDLFVNAWTGTPNLVYMNNGDGTFTRNSASVLDTAGISSSNEGTGSSWADIDQDGDMDCFISSIADGQSVLMKNGGSGNNYLAINCAGVTSNKSALGAKIRILCSMGTKKVWQMREITSQSAGSYSGQNSLQQVFGLGNATTIDSIKISWPSGINWDTTNIAANSNLTITEHKNVKAGIEEASFLNSFHIYPNPANDVLHFNTTELRGRFNVAITDMLGRTLFSNDFHENNFDVNVAKLLPGIYFIKLSSGDATDMRKVIIER